MSMEQDVTRYRAAAHAMQSGVAANMQIDPADTQPKQLRVGVNAAMRDLASVVHLLVAKGIITEEEYTKAIADGMEEEKASYEKLLSDYYQTNITLA